MPLEFLADLAFALVDLIRMSLIVAIPAFILVLPGRKMHSWFREKYELSWIVAAFAATFIMLLPIVFVLYLFPFAIGYFGSELSGLPAPEFMQPTLVDYAMAAIGTIIKNLLSAVMFVILLMPLLFFGAFAEEKIKEKLKIPALGQTFAAVFLTSVLAWIVVLFVFPWVVTAIFWKLYWSPI